MPLTLKELVVVFGIATIVFALAQRVFRAFILDQDYRRRRNLWLTLTVFGFLSPNFWIFVLLATPLLLLKLRRESNPASLYLLLMTVVPSVPVAIPMIGVSHLFDIDIYMLLSFVIMVPTALRQYARGSKVEPLRLSAMDYCIALYGIVAAIFYVHAQTPNWGVYPSTFTESLRRAVVFAFSVLVPYVVVSRSSRDRRQVVDMLATFCLSCLVLASIAVFESSRHWLLYAEFPSRWGGSNISGMYLMRGGSLRAVATTGHSGALGTLLAIAFGFWLYLRRGIPSKLARLCIPIILGLGLLADYSRGPWLGALSIYVAFALLGPNPFRGFGRITVSILIIALVIGLSPLRDRVVSVIPFLGGSVDSQNIDYRHHLLDAAVPIIEASPILGDSDALLKMGTLRQNGIIDLVNSYLEVLLNNGIIGLSLFLGFSTIALRRAWVVSKKFGAADPEDGALGLSLISCIIGLLIMLWPSTLSTGGYVLYFGLGGICLAYTSIGRSTNFGETATFVTTGEPSQSTSKFRNGVRPT
jgi:O-antigen ligase